MTQTWQAGDWAVVHIPGLPGSLIQEMQEWSGVRTDYEHAIGGLADGWIVEAQPGGAVRTRMHFPPEHVCWSTGRIPGPTLEQRITITAAWQDAAARHVGYSYLDYLAIAARQWHLWAPGLKRYIASSGHMICSQLVDWGCLQGGWHLFDDGRWPGFVRPGDLADLIAAPPPQR